MLVNAPPLIYGIFRRDFPFNFPCIRKVSEVISQLADFEFLGKKQEVVTPIGAVVTAATGVKKF